MVHIWLGNLQSFMAPSPPSMIPSWFAIPIPPISSLQAYMWADNHSFPFPFPLISDLTSILLAGQGNLEGSGQILAAPHCRIQEAQSQVRHILLYCCIGTYPDLSYLSIYIFCVPLSCLFLFVSVLFIDIFIGFYFSIKYILLIRNV